MEGIIIVARVSSTRLPQKVIKTIDGKKMIIELQIEKAKKVIDKHDKIILATSENDDDNILVEIAEKNGIKSYRGSLAHVPLRIKNAAKTFGLTSFALMESDELFVDIKYLRNMMQILKTTNVDMIIPKGLPLGAWSYGFRTSLIEEYVNTVKSDNFDGWGLSIQKIPNRIYLAHSLPSVDFPDYEAAPRLTLDYPEDFILLQDLYKLLDANIDDLKLVLKVLSQNPTLLEINKGAENVWSEKTG